MRRALLQVDAEEVERGLNVKRGALDEDGLVDLVAAVVLRPDGVAGLVAHAEKDHGAGNLLLIEGEVLAAHLQVRLDDALVAEDFGCRALDLAALIDWTNKDSSITHSNGAEFQADMNLQDAWTFNLAGSYDFGFMKTYLATQYFKDARDAGSVLDYVGFFDEDSVFNNNEGDVKFNKGAVANTGYGVHLSTAFDVLGGTMKAGIGYEYSLSKRTLVYTGLGYTKRELDANYEGVTGSWEEEGYDFALGLVHKF